MIINHEKFQAIDLEKNKSEHSRKPITINNRKIKTVSSEELVGIQLEDRLNFNNNVNSICRPTGNKLNALIRLKRHLNFSSKEVLINSHVVLTFNYCSWVQMFSNAKSS